MDTKNYLDGEITRLYETMSKLDPSSEEYGKLEEHWTQLMDRKLELEKHNADCKDRIGRFITDNCKWAVPLGVSVVMTLLAYTFEAKGVIPTGIGKKWADKLTKY